MLCEARSLATAAQSSLSMCEALVVIAATLTAADEQSPVIQLVPGQDARCVAAVSVDSAGLVRAVPQWWSRRYRWEGVNFACEKRAQDGSTPFTWKVPGFGISAVCRLHLLVFHHGDAQRPLFAAGLKPQLVLGKDLRETRLKVNGRVRFC